MAAEGMTNREIAQALFLTEKTIEHHLSSVYRKLDIRSRVQLVRALPEGEPVARIDGGLLARSQGRRGVDCAPGR